MDMKDFNLSRINEDKPHELYQPLFAALLKRCQTVAPGHGFRFKNELYSMDASTIDLCLSVFPWASFRNAKGGIKLHVAMNHKANLPEFLTVTEARTHELISGFNSCRTLINIDLVRYLTALLLAPAITLASIMSISGIAAHW